MKCDVTSAWNRQVVVWKRESGYSRLIGQSDPSEGGRGKGLGDTSQGQRRQGLHTYGEEKTSNW